MYYNPMANILFRLLGQAAARSFAEESRRAAGESQGYSSPFDDMFGTSQPQQDDTPIDVEAEVVDEDGTTEKQRAHKRWDDEREQTEGHQLDGEVVFAGSKGYNTAVAVITVLLFIVGVASRIYSLVMGNIFSATVVPVALGAIGGILMTIIGSALIWKKGAWKLPFDSTDLALVFFSAVLMGYMNLPCALIAALIGALYMKAAPNKKLPFFASYLAVAAIAMFTVHFPGLVF